MTNQRKLGTVVFGFAALAILSLISFGVDLPGPLDFFNYHKPRGPGNCNESVPAAVASNTARTRNNRPSMVNVPKFCETQLLPNQLPVLTPSASLFELNGGVQYGQLDQDDERVTKYIWDHCDVFLRPPDGRKSNFHGPDPSMGQDKVVQALLGPSKGDGFYVECGALDGVLSSNTFEFENEYGWKGLLIEPDPANLEKLFQHHRNAWIAHSCLSIEPRPQQVLFKPSFDLGRISEVVPPDYGHRNGTNGEFLVQCFPLYSFLAALGVRTVDYFSLDVEGDELKILRTIPFDKVLIKVISVEFLTSPEGEEPLKIFMESKGYLSAHRFYHQGRPFDIIFVHESVKVDPGLLSQLSVGL